MAPTLAPCADDLRGLTRTDPDPRVRRRAHALLLVAEGRTVAAVARLFETGPNRIRAWRARFLAGGRRGLADEPRSGRPPKLNAAALAFLAEALEASPQAYGLPVTVWSIRDLREVLAARLGVRVCTATVHRAVQRLGYRYRRPRHDLRHRQDQEAVAAAEEVLAWRRKKRWRPRRTPPRLLGRVRGPPSPPPGEGVAAAGVPAEGAGRRGGRQVRRLRGARLRHRPARLPDRGAQGRRRLRRLPRPPGRGVPRRAAGRGPGQRRLPQGAARQGLVDGPAGPGPPAVAARLRA